MLVDAHCHLDFCDFDVDREAVFLRAKGEGVQHFVVPGTVRSRWNNVLALGQRDEVSIGLGLHPYFIQAHQAEDIDALDQALEENAQVVAIGECGIDARFSDTWEDQWQFFNAQLRLAKAHKLPVIIHCVHANDQVAKRLRQQKLPAGGLIHAFAGSPEQAKAFIDLGFVLGLGGAATYSRAKRLQRAIKSLPDDAFVLETDSPDMPLCEQQGERNEPANVATVCRHVAALREQSDKAIANASTKTATQLFTLPLAPSLS
jgi:TatD DNase family protein